MKKPCDESNLLTKEEIEANNRLKEINKVIENLRDLCMLEPEASIILSVNIPNKASKEDGAIVILYAGSQVEHLTQLDFLTQTNPQFMEDLKLFLDIKIKQQMAKTGTTGSKLTDQLLASLSEENKQTKLN